MLLTTLTTGEEVHFYRKSIVINFNGKRRVLSTSADNGGYREDIESVYNHDGTMGAGIATTLRAPTHAEHMALIASEIGLNPLTTVGISTAAQMENVSIISQSHQEITVTAIVTGGVETNGGRVGDPASWDELEQMRSEAQANQANVGGTINIILHINVDLSPGALARTLVTCTEAKTAALQELVAPSRYSMGLATGSGTDSTIIIANAESDITLTSAGKHSKFGELIGRAVKAAVKEALFKQSNLSPDSQHNVLKRVSRFGINSDKIWDRYKESGGTAPRAVFEEFSETVLVDGSLVTYISLYCHLIDQLMWELISINEAVTAGSELMRLMDMTLPKIEPISQLGSGVHFLVQNLETGLSELISRKFGSDGEKSERGGMANDTHCISSADVC